MNPNRDENLAFFKTKPPTFNNGSDFLGYKVPAAQTFTSFSPSSDMDAYLQNITGLGGYQQREFLQSSSGTSVLDQSMSGSTDNALTYLGPSAFHSKAACQQDSDCGNSQICYTFNELTFGPQQGPTCSAAVYPEIILGNNYNEGKPLRQYANTCRTDTDCEGVDRLTGKPKKGMTCNHFYKGPSEFSEDGLCQVQYENNGERHHLKTPPGWTTPLNSKLKQCNTQADCGETGINGWTRCVSGSDDGNKYCVWPGQTATPNPKELKNAIPRGFTAPQPVPTGFHSPTKMQKQALSTEASAAARPQDMSVGGGLRNRTGPPAVISSLFSKTKMF